VPEVHEFPEEYYHIIHRSREREDRYTDNVNLHLQHDLDMLILATGRDLGFDYKLKLSRGLRKLRKRLGYGR